jgi:hypothetical protein
MSKLGIVGATALSLALAIATPAFAAGFRGVHGGGAMHVSSDGSRVPQASADSVVSSADAANCRQLGAYHDSTSGEYMDSDGLWRPCDRPPMTGRETTAPRRLIWRWRGASLFKPRQSSNS